MYSEKIMEEFYNPTNYGVIKGASGVGKIVSDVGSEIIKIYIKVEDEKVVEAQFQTYGGVVAIAMTSIATNMMIGKSVSACEKFDTNALLQVAGEIPENKMYLAQAVVLAVRDAVADYRDKKSKNED